MKIFIGSDIHGSEANLKRFLSEIEKTVANDESYKIVLLGDIYYHGPRNPFPEGYAPMKVAELLNGKKERLAVIKGNCDSEVDQMISEFEFGSDFSGNLNGHNLYFTHGHKCNPELPPSGAKAGDIVFYGHFHRASLKEIDGVRYVCVGAIGLSPAGVERSYAVIDGYKVTVKGLDDGNVIFEFVI
ncbi:MAG: phosphodiesterase [Bacteroides sp.]|nr:phosphodiesterase [Bacillota bacterium]MCM1394083.1 phosphodiesterase [[Eubacterium] siraeum]MCM1455159.1 phosphodiesterase [Bacteroides sp.]